MANAVMTRSNFPESMKDNIRATWGTEIKEVQKIWPRVFYEISSEDNDEEFLTIPGLGLPGLRDEGEGTPGDTTGETYTTTFRHIFSAKKITFTREMIGDNKQMLHEKMTRELARVMPKGEEAACAAVFNSAKSATLPSRFGGDRKPLLSTSHKTYAGTASNTTTNYMAPSQNSIETMLNMMRSNKNERGIPDPLMAKGTITSISNCLKFKRFLSAPMVANSTDNAPNVIPGEGLNTGNLVEMPFITNPLFWAIQSDIPEDEGLVFVNRMELELNEDEDVQEWKLIYVAGQRYSVGPINWRCIYGQA